MSHHRRWRRAPRVCLGQILIGVALSALPLALIIPVARDVTSSAGLVMIGVFCLVGIFEVEFVFWCFLAPVARFCLLASSAPGAARPGNLVASEGIAWIDESRGPDPPERAG